jgi:EAL and modified HD-GYP domain-containing signal transduction protein
MHIASAVRIEVFFHRQTFPKGGPAMSTNPSNCTDYPNRLFVASDEVAPRRNPFPSAFANFATAHRHFVLQPIYKFNREVFACEALFRNGWEDHFEGDGDLATRIMIDNWLLYGLEDLAEAPTVFINCTRDSLLSGLLPLLPSFAVLEILEDVEPDDEVVKACRCLKSLGYRICLDDFNGTNGTERLVDLADFIKIDFRISDAEERATLLRNLSGRDVQLIAEKIETEEEFCDAVREGFGLFQGFYFRQRTSFMKTGDPLDQRNCLQMLDLLQGTGFPIEALVDCIDREPGIECRLLRRANWIAEPDCPVNSVSEALHVIGKSEFECLVTLAMITRESFLDLPPGSHFA